MSSTATRTAARPMWRYFQAARPFRASPFRQPLNRRFQGTASSAEATGAEQQSLAKRLWNSPVGVKTVHFWAPVMKWGLVLAGISDFARPASALSLTQNIALMATGMIWTRWCLIIKPKNVLLAAVNFFLALVGITQVTRIMLWRRTQEESTVSKVESSVKDAVSDTKATAKQVVE
ncbi:UPF0041-domain-containing protein [Xylona heveae TC161]|uniref:Mitochondrial pyruvate carrier n=1 Tax=Xylona heveae (strain CBS 132557 / TC161) TaxID=1328760 RepID=A0A165FD03_XYLHT|nr:UPF0041-domain-containing protein [Xylona heveae TC161]KZF20838.1 UPF0041-domain-containing protein [Xylona heveae TC161]